MDETSYLNTEPVRLYGRIFAVVTAALALAAHYIPDLPTALILGVVSALLFGGAETVRSRVTPTAKP